MRTERSRSCWWTRRRGTGPAHRRRGLRIDSLQGLDPFQVDRWFTATFSAAHPEVLQRWLGVFAANDVACYAASCTIFGDADLRPLLSRICARTAALVGEQDAATPPAMARDLADGIAGATLRIIPDAKHLSPIEKPAVIATAIASLL